MKIIIIYILNGNKIHAHNPPRLESCGDFGCRSIPLANNMKTTIEIFEEEVTVTVGYHIEPPEKEVSFLSNGDYGNQASAVEVEITLVMGDDGRDYLPELSDMQISALEDEVLEYQEQFKD